MFFVCELTGPNVLLSTVMEPGYVSLRVVSAGQFVNTSWLKKFALGNAISVRALQYENTAIPKFVASGRLTSFRVLQPLNASSPMVTALGNEMFSSEVHP